jgi:hypothetical protein
LWARQGQAARGLHPGHAARGDARRGNVACHQHGSDRTQPRLRASRLPRLCRWYVVAGPRAWRCNPLGTGLLPRRAQRRRLRGVQMALAGMPARKRWPIQPRRAERRRDSKPLSSALHPRRHVAVLVPTASITSVVFAVSFQGPMAAGNLLLAATRFSPAISNALWRRRESKPLFSPAQGLNGRQKPAIASTSFNESQHPSPMDGNSGSTEVSHRESIAAEVRQALLVWEAGDHGALLRLLRRVLLAVQFELEDEPAH